MSSPFTELFPTPKPKVPLARLPWDNTPRAPAPASPEAELGAVMRQAQQFSPDQVAEARAMSPRIGLSPSVILRNMDAVKQIAGERTFEPGQFKRENPLSAAWLRFAENAAVAYDDTESLAGIERAFGKGTLVDRYLTQFGNIGMPASRQVDATRRPSVVIDGAVQRQVDRGIAVVDAGVVGTRRMLGEDTPATRRDADALRAMLDEPVPALKGVWRFVGGTAEILPAMLPGLALGAVGGAVAAVALPAAGASAAVTAAGAATATFLGRYLSSFALEGGNAFLQFEALRDADDRAIPTERARGAALTVGLYGGLLDAVSMGVVLKPFGGAARAIMAGGMSRTLQQATLRGITGRAVRAFGTGVGAEVTTETLQQGISLAAEQGMRSASNADVGTFGDPKTPTNFAPISRERVVRELAETAVQTFFATALISGFGSGAQFATDLNRMAASQQQVDALGQLAGVADGSKLRARDPQAFRSAVDATIPADKKTVGVDAERVVTLLQEQGIRPEDFAVQAGITVQELSEAAERGGDVLLQTADVVANLTGTPVWDVLYPDLKVGPDGMSAREIEAASTRMDADMAKVREEMDTLAKDGPTSESGQGVYGEVLAMLTASAVGVKKSGQLTPANLEAQARTISAFYEVMGGRLAIDPMALFESRNYQVLAPARADPLYRLLKVQQNLENAGDTTSEAYMGLAQQIAALESGAFSPESASILEQGPSLTPEEVAMVQAADAREFRSWGMSASDIGVELGVSAEVVTELLAMDPVAVTQEMVARAAFFEQAAFHGTPHKVDAFRTAKIGTGEGAQAYGWGLYFAEMEDIADGYRRTLAEKVLDIESRAEPPEGSAAYKLSAILEDNGGRITFADGTEIEELIEGMGGVRDPRAESRSRLNLVYRFPDGTSWFAGDHGWNVATRGNLYAVDIADGAVATFLDWDKPLSKQAPEVQVSIIALAGDESPLTGEFRKRIGFWINADGTLNETHSVNGEDVVTLLGADKEASEILLAAGIRGIQYLDSSSRRAGEGTRNLVVFDEADITITRENGKPVTPQERATILEQRAPDVTETLEPMMDVDGVQRSTRNSEGYPIEMTEAGLVSFWRWFGDSIMVDDAGRPRVLYHGSAVAGLEELKASGAGRKGAFFSTEQVADTYATGAGDTYAVYLRIENPKSVDFEGSSWDGREGARMFGVRIFGETTRFTTREEADTYAAENGGVVEAIRADRPSTDEEATSAREAGHDGLIISNVVDAGDPSKIAQPHEVTVVFDESSVKSVTDNSGAYNPAAGFLAQRAPDARPANAFIRARPSAKTIGLMRTANPTSVLHEFAHDWLNILTEYAAKPDAPVALVADLAVILKWLGVTSADQLGVKEQEQFARGAERYYATANAPSVGLARAFARFRGWFTREYRRIKAMLVPLDPEVQDVFDRMLATEDALAEVRGELGVPMFTADDGEALGKSPQEMAEYLTAVETSNAASSAALLKRVLAETMAETRTARKERKAEIQEAVTAEVDAEPTYQARAQLAESPLNRDVFVGEFGPEAVRTMPKGSVTEEGQVTPDEYALEYGFRDGAAFVEAMQTTPTRAREIAARVQAQMEEEFPDPMERSDVMRTEAEKAAHKSETDKTLVDELRALAKVNGIVPPSVEAVRQVAREQIAAVRVRDLSATPYRNAERTAATASTKAWRAGDAATAEFHKRRQLLNHILAREAQAALDKVEVIRKYARRQESDAAQERLGKAGEVYQDAMNALLDQYDFRVASNPVTDTREGAGAQIAAWVAELESDAARFGVPLVVPVPQSVLTAATRRPYKTLPFSHLLDLYETMRAIAATARADGEVKSAETRQAFSDTVDALVAGLQTHWTAVSAQYLATASRLDEAGETLDSAHGALVKPEMVFRLADGDVPNGVWGRTFMERANDAAAAYNRKLEEFFAAYTAAIGEVPKARITGFFRAYVAVPGVAGPGTTNARMTGDNVFRLLLNYGNASSIAAINAGTMGGRVPFTDANVQALFRLLSPQEIQAAQSVWDAVSMFWEEMADLEQRMTGFRPAKVSAQPLAVVANDGSTVTLKGGYYPLKYDGRASPEAYVQDQKRAEGKTEGLVPFVGSGRATTSQGHLIQRQKANGRLVDLSASVVAEHMTETLYDLTHREVVYDVQKLLLNPRVSGAIEASMGAGTYRQALLPWATALAKQSTPNRSVYERILFAARAGATVVGLGLRVTTFFLNLGGIGQVWALLGPKYTARGLAEVARWGRGAFTAADHLAPAVAYRSSSLDREIRDMATALTAKGQMTDRTAFAFKLITIADRAVSVAAFWGGYYQWLDAHPTDMDGAINAGEQAVRLSQGANDPKDLAQAASGGDAQRMVTSFYSNGSALYSLFWRAERNRKEKREVMSTVLATMVGAWILPAVVEPYIRGRGPDEDDEMATKVAWWAWQIASFPAQAVPLVREFAQGMEPGQPVSFKKFEPPFTRPLTVTIGTAFRVASNVLSADDEWDRKDLKMLVETIGYWAKLPTGQVWTTGAAFADWLMGYDVAPADFIRNPPR